MHRDALRQRFAWTDPVPQPAAQASGQKESLPSETRGSNSPTDVRANASAAQIGAPETRTPGPAQQIHFDNAGGEGEEGRSRDFRQGSAGFFSAMTGYVRLRTAAGESRLGLSAPYEIRCFKCKFFMCLLSFFSRLFVIRRPGPARGCAPRANWRRDRAWRQVRPSLIVFRDLLDQCRGSLRYWDSCTQRAGFTISARRILLLGLHTCGDLAASLVRGVASCSDVWWVPISPVG